MSAATISAHYGYGWGWYGSGRTNTYVNEWDEGTLLVDIVDAASNELVWRGSVTPGRTTALSYRARVGTFSGGWLTNEALVDDVHNGVTALRASVFARPKLLLPWLGREHDPDP